MVDHSEKLFAEKAKTIGELKGIDEYAAKFNQDFTDGQLLNILFNRVAIDGLHNMDDAIEVYSILRRTLIIGDIEPALGASISEFIRIYNLMDYGIPAEDRKPIVLLVDSNGGDLDATFSIIDAIEASTTPVYTINIGNAYSGGFLIYINGHKRIAFPHSRFMFHEGSISLSGDSHKFRNYVDFYDKELLWIQEIILNRSNWTKEDYQKVKKDDYWLTTTEAIENGFADIEVKSYEEIYEMTRR